MRVFFATNNAHKAHEVQAILQEAGIDVVFETLADHPELPEPAEDHDTFVGNALQKARTIAALLPEHVVMADDSGIAVDALEGRPGVHSKRFSKEATDEANNRLLVELLGDRPPAERTAHYCCVVALVAPGGWERTCEGKVFGRIGTVEQGAGGFGYDPLFWPDDFPGRTMAELTLEEKNGISHRGRAFRQLPELLP